MDIKEGNDGAMRALSRNLPVPSKFQRRETRMTPAEIQDPLINQWIEFKLHNQGRSETTAYKYRLALVRLKLWLIEQDLDLLTATPELLEQYCGLVLYQRGQKAKTRAPVVAAVRGFYAWAARFELVAKDPAKHIPVPKVGMSLPRPAQLQHAEKILMQPDLKTFKGLRDAAMLSVLIGCGCRVSGLVALNESDLLWISTPNGTERLVIRFTEKGKAERMVPAPLETGLLIRAYLGHDELERIERVTTTGERVLFVNLNNTEVRKYDYFGEKRRIGQESIDRIIKAYGLAAGLPRQICHAHAFRHLVGTELAEADIDLLQRQALLGHQDPKTTEIYTQLAMRKLTESVDKANPLGKIQTPVSELARMMRIQKPQRPPDRSR